MLNADVRLSEIEIQNFKNVKNGYLSFENTRKPYQASVLGLYGQNGSGKTALIDVLQILKYLLCGQPVPEQYAEYINVDAVTSHLWVHFTLHHEDEVWDLYYEFSLGVKESADQANLDVSVERKAVDIIDEKVSYSYHSNTRRVKKNVVIDTGGGMPFSPVRKYDLLFGKDKNVRNRLIAARGAASAGSRSFIFSREMLSELSAREKEIDSDEFIICKGLLERMASFGNYELFVIGTSNTGIISLNALPLSFKYRHDGKGHVGNIAIPLNEPAEISEDIYQVVCDVIEDMDIVLQQVIPGLTIRVQDLGTIILRNGQKGHSIQLMSAKNSHLIPLRYESEGIKKIISVLQLFIVMYNVPSFTVAVDELDSGIFEYLLGELLRILSEKGKGQLIFTSHNLRPLETLDKGFIAFTTTNPDNRYIRLTNIKTNNNLRDFYFRDIVLGEQSEEIYEPTNNAEIALALREAGEHFG